MSELEQLQQTLDALLQECEERLRVVEQERLPRQPEQPTRAAADADQDSDVELSESSDVNHPEKNQALVGTTDEQPDAANRNRAKNRAANQAALQLLFDTYPVVFSRDQVRPLKIGIQEDLIEDGKLARNRIKRALASYVRNPHYLRSLQTGAERIGLDGMAAGTVSEDEAAHARDKLKAMKAERRERQKVEREAERKQVQAAREQRLNSKLDQLLKMNNRAG